MELKDKLASIDTLVFDDPDLLLIINEWARSQGYANYAAFIVRVIESNTNDAINWARLRATDGLTLSEMVSKIIPNVVETPV